MSSGFITEAEIEAKRQSRQAEWDKVRTAEDPVAAPEEAPPDHRSLFEKLQEQKMRKQEEFEESHKLKNLVKGLDDDEADFLELVDKTKMDLEKKKKMEEVMELNDFRSKMAEFREQELNKHIRQQLGLDKSERKPSKTFDDDLPSIGTGKTTQSKLLAGIVKRKVPPPVSSNESNSSGEVSKKPKLDQQPPGGSSTSPAVISSTRVLPGLASYSDSSNSEDESSDSEHGDSVPRDLCGRQILQPEEEAETSKKKK
jgi:hypothetical protein